MVEWVLRKVHPDDSMILVKAPYSVVHSYYSTYFFILRSGFIYDSLFRKCYLTAEALIMGLSMNAARTFPMCLLAVQELFNGSTRRAMFQAVFLRMVLSLHVGNYCLYFSPVSDC